MTPTMARSEAATLNISFTEKVLRVRRNSLVANTLKNEIPSRIRKAKEATAAVDYKCGFKNGACYVYQAKFNYQPPEPHCNCCCKQCAHELGYLDHEGIYTKYIDVYNKAWNNQSGFYDSSIGCKLPRFLRSLICLSYCCNSHVSRKDQKIILAVHKLKKGWQHE